MYNKYWQRCNVTANTNELIIKVYKCQNLYGHFQWYSFASTFSLIFHIWFCGEKVRSEILYKICSRNAQLTVVSAAIQTVRLVFFSHSLTLYVSLKCDVECHLSTRGWLISKFALLRYCCHIRIWGYKNLIIKNDLTYFCWHHASYEWIKYCIWQ